MKTLNKALLLTENSIRCDFCGKAINGEIFEVFDENHNLQDNIFECSTCKFGENERKSPKLT